MKNTNVLSTSFILSSEALLEHWQGHRRVTRRVIEAFPDEKLFSYSLGGMRPFSEMVFEMIGIADAGIEGLVSRNWQSTGNLRHHTSQQQPKTKSELLAWWDDLTRKIDTRWPSIPPNRFSEVDKVFGEYEGPVYGSFLYWIDNEIHHRGQGYVYLRTLGIEPPPFWDRE